MRKHAVPKSIVRAIPRSLAALGEIGSKEAASLARALRTQVGQASALAQTANEAPAKLTAMRHRARRAQGALRALLDGTEQALAFLEPNVHGKLPHRGDSLAARLELRAELAADALVHGSREARALGTLIKRMRARWKQEQRDYEHAFEADATVRDFNLAKSELHILIGKTKLLVLDKLPRGSPAYDLFKAGPRGPYKKRAR